ncbi:MAG: TraB/GumN family protein [Pseudomonadota bacterium]
MLTTRRWAPALWVLGLLLFLAGPAGARSFIWEISQGGKVLYLMGSMHLAKPDLYPLAKEIQQAFDRSGLLVVEADIKPEDQDRIQELTRTNGLYPQGETLSGGLSSKTRAKMKELGIDPAEFDHYRPWLAAILLQIQKYLDLGLDPKYGVDRYFLDQARGRKPILELEGAMYQMKLFARLSAGEQELFLYATLVELANLSAVMDQAIKAWSEGDAEKFEYLFFKDYKEYPELEPVAEKLIFQRNREMQSKIEGYLSNSGQTHFVVVGALHLVGEPGIIAGLKNKGWQVRQL